MKVQESIALLARHGPVEHDGHGHYWADVGDRRIEFHGLPDGSVWLIRSFPAFMADDPDEEGVCYAKQSWDRVEDAIAAARAG